jgi:FKBP-type peptidyl-prolyl cis-trans isomerase
MMARIRTRWRWAAFALALLVGAGGAALVVESHRASGDAGPSAAAAAPRATAPVRPLLPVAAPILTLDPPAAPPDPGPVEAPPIEAPPIEAPPVVVAPTLVTTASGLQYLDVEVGDGAAPRPGQRVVVHYNAWVDDHGANGKLLDSSRGRAAPLEFSLGGGHVIPGWEEGISTMRVGGQRTLIVPAALVYGDRPANDRIPPGATLRFEIELLDVTDP